MVGIIAIIIFLLLLIMGTPLAFVIGIVAFFGIAMLDTVPNIVVIQRMFTGLNSFVLLAVPLFILAANLMNQGKISEKLIEFSIALVGHIRGGLAQANVVVSMFFAGISGSSTADTAGIGKVLIPSMEKQGYSKETAVAVTAASSTIGAIIPPSITMVIYGSLASASIGSLFLGGVIPGILIGLSMMVVVYIISLKHNYPMYKRVRLLELIKLMFVSLPPLLTPALIIGGIVGGIVTPTEAAVVACIYAFILGMFVYKTIKWRDLPEIIYDTLKLSSLSLFALAAASALGQLMSYYNVSSAIAEFFGNFQSHDWVFLISIVLLFLFLGTFMDAIPAMILFVPILMPAARLLEINEVHLGLIIVMCLSIGLVTPPYGLCLLLASSIAKLSIHRATIAVAPYLVAILVVLMLVVFFPQIVLWLPKLLQPQWFS